MMTIDTIGTVFVVDDDPDVLGLLATLLQARGARVEAFSSAEDFLSAFDPAQRGCLVADVRMPGMSGLDLQERLSDMGATLPVIILSGYADVPMAVRAMQAGAMTLLQKPCPVHELWIHVEKALERDAKREQQLLRKADVGRRLASLAAAEQEVLERLIAGKANKQIAMELDVGLRTIELRRANIMKKMRADSLAELVHLVFLSRGPGEGSG